MGKIEDSMRMCNCGTCRQSSRISRVINLPFFFTFNTRMILVQKYRITFSFEIINSFAFNELSYIYKS